MEGNTLVSILPLVGIVLLFYLVLIRPQQKRRRQLAELQRQLHRGQRVMTNSMLFANVAAVDGDEIVLEIAPGVECRYSKSAVVQVLDPDGGGGWPGRGDVDGAGSAGSSGDGSGEGDTGEHPRT